jgi:hypothetical protein
MRHPLYHWIWNHWAWKTAFLLAASLAAPAALSAQANIAAQRADGLSSIVRASLLPFLNLRYISERGFYGGLESGRTFRGAYRSATSLTGSGDNAFTQPTGEGAEVNLARNWMLHSDFVPQRWDTDPIRLEPLVLSMGVSYSLPFRGDGWAH